LAQFSPQVFGKYFLVDKIAVGGMAEIFKAKTYSATVASRTSSSSSASSQHLSDNSEFVEMFIDEAKVSVALQHQQHRADLRLRAILENYFIAMECVDGKDARRACCASWPSSRKLPAAELRGCYIAHEVARGLDYAHKKTDLRRASRCGIVHRDISPVEHHRQLRAAR
jgi:serine/threonine protein kinase